MEQQEKSCCASETNRKNEGVLSGILFGLLPHSFCIAFALFSIIGAVTISGFMKKFLLIPNLFFLLVVVSIFLATLSSAIYLERSQCFCSSGLKRQWKYITTVYSVTILANLLMFFVVFPALANMHPKTAAVQGATSTSTTLQVKIPCTGHAPLIIDEIKKDSGVQSVEFDTPDVFKIKYDSNATSPEKIASAEIFKTYEATIN